MRACTGLVGRWSLVDRRPHEPPSTIHGPVNSSVLYSAGQNRHVRVMLGPAKAGHYESLGPAKAGHYNLRSVRFMRTSNLRSVRLQGTSNLRSVRLQGTSNLRSVRLQADLGDRG